MPLKNRQVPIPNGFQFRQPETGWVPERYSSFDSVVNQVIAHRQGNPYLMQLNGWSTDRATVEMEVDNYNTRICQAMGPTWAQWVEGGPTVNAPFQPPPPQPILSQLSGGVAAVKKLASGFGLLFEWDQSGRPPVEKELAEKRASICVTCPKNDKGGLAAWFTSPFAATIKARLARLHELNLKTSHDENLQVCSACACPLGLKVWTPLDLVEKKITPEVRTDLDPRCWILSRDA
jgi:hypothetical protein